MCLVKHQGQGKKYVCVCMEVTPKRLPRTAKVLPENQLQEQLYNFNSREIGSLFEDSEKTATYCEGKKTN